MIILKGPFVYCKIIYKRERFKGFINKYMLCTNMKIKVLRIRPQPLFYKTVEEQSKFNL